MQLVRDENELGLYTGAAQVAEYLGRMGMRACVFMYAYVAPDKGLEVIHAAYRSEVAGTQGTFTISVVRRADGRWLTGHAASTP
jgi:hypothetical protein